jgi:sigma-E factor negative regulatory protein RseA
MTDQIREQVSALLDGELPRDEVGLLVRRMERDPDLRRAFGSYSLIGETLRAPGGRTAHPSFAARVSAAIDAPGSTVTSAAPAAARHPRWKRPAVATALAASVALIAIVLVQPFTGPTSAPAAVERWAKAGAASPTPAQSQRLAGYLVAHSQFSSPIGRRNVWSGLLAADPGLTRVSYETLEAP